MLEKIALLDSQVIRALLVAIAGVLGLVLSYFGVDETLFGAQATKLIDALMLLTTTGGIAYAAYARITKPTPPISETAAQKSQSLASKQVGNSLGVLLCVGVLAFSMVALVGCSAFAKPMSFKDQLAYAYGQHTAVQTAAANSVKARELSPEQGEQLLELADQSRRILDAAKVAATGGDISTAEGQLELATNLLVQLQTYLRRQSQ